MIYSVTSLTVCKLVEIVLRTEYNETNQQVRDGVFL
jgi:hypothetical protein